MESGLDEVLILVDGVIVVHDIGLEGITSLVPSLTGITNPLFEASRHEMSRLLK